MPPIEKVITDILEREGYSSYEEFVRDMALWLASARTEQYKAEWQSFKLEYGLTTSDFERVRNSNRVELLSEEGLKAWELLCLPFAGGRTTWRNCKGILVRVSKQGPLLTRGLER